MEGSNQTKEYFQDVNPYQYLLKIGDKFVLNNLKKIKNVKKIEKLNVTNLCLTTNHLAYIQR
jgi:hypothetical protein